MSDKAECAEDVSLNTITGHCRTAYYVVIGRDSASSTPSNFSAALFLMRAVESAPKCLSLFQRWHFRLCHPLSVLS